MKLYINIGISGVGKSTFVNEFLANDSSLKVVETDAIRAELTGDAGNQSMNGTVFTIAKQRVRNLLATKNNVIFDATSLNPKDRSDFVLIGKQMGAEVIAVVFPLDVEKAKKQNKLRTRQVPEHVIEKQAAKFVAPKLSEGFTSIVKA